MPARDEMGSDGISKMSSTDPSASGVATELCVDEEAVVDAGALGIAERNTLGDGGDGGAAVEGVF